MAKVDYTIQDNALAILHNRKESLNQDEIIALNLCAAAYASNEHIEAQILREAHKIINRVRRDSGFREI